MFVQNRHSWSKNDFFGQNRNFGNLWKNFEICGKTSKFVENFEICGKNSKFVENFEICGKTSKFFFGEN